jgi:UTP--glucose-1-phosphate uridylyltransferase
MGGSSSSSEGWPAGDFAAFRRKMQEAGLSEELIEQFAAYYGMLAAESRDTGLVRERDIEPVRADDIAAQDELTRGHREQGERCLDQAVMIKLNGGLGTSMGMPYAKSLLEVKSGYTFLDVAALQARAFRKERDAGVPLVFMNSFNTDRDTREYFREKAGPLDVEPQYFQQNRFPKILADSLEPAEWPQEPELEWNPPGHGDLYAALRASGMLQRLLEEGKRYAFVSNVDNLGAVVDPAMLGYFVERELPLLMEVAERSPSDKKGGHLAKLEDGRLILRETAQCPREDEAYFQDIGRHQYFNTNNIWLDLQQLEDRINARGLPQLPLIVNPKTLDPRDERTPEVYQLETAMGAAISSFERSGAIQVGRERFAPVKKTNGLLAVRSDCYVLEEDYQLKPNPRRTAGPIEIELDSDYFKKIDQFEERFPFGPPSLLDCTQLQVEGDVAFGRNVICRGRVRIRNGGPGRRSIEDGSQLEGEIDF